MGEADFPAGSIASILDGMRDEYWQGVTETETAFQESLECILFRLGNELFAFETPFAAEVLRMPRLVKIPKVTGIFAGAFNLRGEITLAIDIAPLLGLPSTLPGNSSRLLIVKSPLFKTGLITDAVLEVTDLSMDTLSPPASDTDSPPSPLIRGELVVNDTKVKLLDISRLMNSPEIIINQTSLYGEDINSGTGTSHDS